MPIIFKLELHFDTVEEATDFVGVCFGQQDEKTEEVSYFQNYQERVQRSADAARPMMEYIEAQLAKKGLAPSKHFGVQHESNSTKIEKPSTK